ncbi:MAG: GAF domain-containing protein [Actinomycetota bacterium]
MESLISSDTRSSEGPRATDTSAAAVAAARMGASDVLVFAHTHGRSHLLLGGVGLGEAWAGTVAVEERDEPRFVAATEGQTLRIQQDEPVRIVGPYYASSAALVPADGVVVVIGGAKDWLSAVDEDTLTAAATEAAAALVGTEPTRDLSHELDVYTRLRELLQPVGDRSRTAHHLVRQAADVLDADFVLLLPEPGADLAVARPGWAPHDPGGLREAADLVVSALPQEVLVIQDVRDAPLPSPLSPEDGLRSAMIMPLTSEGFLLAAHASGRPRGFTSLDLDVGTLLAETASVALAAADTASTLDRHVERVRWLLRRDPVTGLPDHRAWADALDATDSGAVVAVGLGNVEAPDRLLQIVGAVLQRQATDTDLVARVGVAEFGLLLRGASLSTAEQIAGSVRERLGPIRRADGSPVGVGFAATPELESVRDAWRVAAGRMLQS